jgi:thiol-disulfide isomerase/thioredoxin
MGIIDLRRLLLATPVLALGALAIWWLALRDDAAGTPRPALAETPPGAVERVGVRKGDLARDFVASGPDGTAFRLSELRGAPVVVNFWATWCGSCATEMPVLKRVQQDAGADNLHIVAVNVGERSNDVGEFLDWLDAPDFRIGMDPDHVVADNYNVSGLPVSVFIDSSGVIRGVFGGELPEAELDALLAAAHAGANAAEPEPRPRLITTVARDDVLEYERVGERVVEFRSRSLRCDDSYCATPAIEAWLARDGVRIVERRTDAMPPAIVVEYDPADDAASLAEALAAELDALDAIYGRDIEVIERD